MALTTDMQVSTIDSSLGHNYLFVGPMADGKNCMVPNIGYTGFGQYHNTDAKVNP